MMISVKNIEKSYGEVKALHGVSLDVNEGELFGLIGPDGAGKTSLIRILVTLLKPDTGSATVNQLDVVDDFRKLRKEIGYMPGRFSLYPDLSVEENMTFFATVFGTTIEENYHLVKDIYQQIEPFKDRLAGRLSGGMKQKLALSCALIHAPKVLILDEPTTGVDAVSRKEFWEMLKRLQKMGITILVSTPYMDEANLCDRVALIQDGNILTIDTPDRVTQNNESIIWAVRTNNMYLCIRDLKRHPGIKSVFGFGEFLHVTLKDMAISPTALEEYLEQRCHTNIVVNPIKPGIEDVFMDLMQKHDS
ncbi:ABC transporter ATP-binding protein [Prolixibacter sp. SD074]|uniref:ABC transporter ATP-binding protein n=1 Tax=Prolixibacter sp. SD074 TaxID=2652391 RepID=UPI001284C445|nr:ABC transporter ATP-binding protein [Prolixibacter sp. SD074]GET29390.1 hypothetical protein SD074_15920 [Prolixibacter sp. SD074]